MHTVCCSCFYYLNVFDGKEILEQTQNIKTKYTCVRHSDYAKNKIQFSKAPNLSSSIHTGISGNLEPINQILPLLEGVVGVV